MKNKIIKLVFVLSLCVSSANAEMVNYRSMKNEERSLNERGVALYKRGEIHQAIELYEMVLGYKRQDLKSSSMADYWFETFDDDFYEVANNLALAYYKAGYYNETLFLLEEMRHGIAHKYGDSSDIENIINIRANSYFNSGLAFEAKGYFEDAWKAYKSSNHLFPARDRLDSENRVKKKHMEIEGSLTDDEKKEQFKEIEDAYWRLKVAYSEVCYLLGNKVNSLSGNKIPTSAKDWVDGLHVFHLDSVKADDIDYVSVLKDQWDNKFKNPKLKKGYTKEQMRDEVISKNFIGAENMPPKRVVSFVNLEGGKYKVLVVEKKREKKYTSSYWWDTGVNSMRMVPIDDKGRFDKDSKLTRYPDGLFVEINKKIYSIAARGYFNTKIMTFPKFYLDIIEVGSSIPENTCKFELEYLRDK